MQASGTANHNRIKRLDLIGRLLFIDSYRYWDEGLRPVFCISSGSTARFVPTRKLGTQHLVMFPNKPFVSPGPSLVKRLLVIFLRRPGRGQGALRPWRRRCGVRWSVGSWRGKRPGERRNESETCAGTLTTSNH